MKKPRPIRVEGEIAYVPLTRGYEAIIDAADVPAIRKYNWTAMPDKRTVYAWRKSEREPPGHSQTIYLHRVIAKAPRGVHVDHADRDGLNNRRSNLRLCSNYENQHNTRKRKNNTSGFKGVYWDKDAKKWRSCILAYGKRHHLGRFNTPEEAHAAYCKASAELHGEFGYSGRTEPPEQDLSKSGILRTIEQERTR